MSDVKKVLSLEALFDAVQAAYTADVATHSADDPLPRPWAPSDLENELRLRTNARIRYEEGNLTLSPRIINPGDPGDLVEWRHNDTPLGKNRLSELTDRCADMVGQDHPGYDQLHVHVEGPPVTVPTTPTTGGDGSGPTDPARRWGQTIIEKKNAVGSWLRRNRLAAAFASLTGLLVGGTMTYDGFMRTRAGLGYATDADGKALEGSMLKTATGIVETTAGVATVVAGGWAGYHAIRGNGSAGRALDIE